MVKDKFDLLKTDKVKNLKKDSHLKETAKAVPIKKKIDRMVYGISVELQDAAEASGESLSGFLKRAGLKLAKEEGLIIKN
ncbi:hypothetical protein [Sulfurimonas sp.]|uniref:hypothetical protein n=1 Tax=Sulfurimonas sp. TaxID=2022749 RepID=UPI002B45D145|nr:hypothetical protein [Sulfurimonas sp.]